MTIFDVIRYPVSNIYLEDELAALPEDLYNEWYNRCAGGYRKVRLAGRVNEIKIIISTQSIASAKANRFNTNGYSYEDLWKAAFTKMLKEMIKNYEPN